MGNSARDKEVFTINVNTGINSSSHLLSSHVRIGSRAQDFVGDECIIFRISSSDTSVNESSTFPSKLLKLSWKVCDVASGTFSESFRILFILSL